MSEEGRNYEDFTKRKSFDSEGSQPLVQKRFYGETLTKQDIDAKKTIEFIDLPNEILGKIMDFVSFDDLLNIESVNKRLKYVVLNVVWPKKNIVNHESIIQYTDYPFIPYDVAIWTCHKRHNLFDRSIEAILSRAKNIQHLDLSIYFYTITNNVCLLLLKAQQLKTLNLSSIKLTKDNLITIANSCKLLEEISFERCFSHSQNIEDGLEILFKQCSNIKYLNLARNSVITGDGCFEFISPTLRYLNLAFCRNLTTNALNILSDRVKNNLETLILEDCTPSENLNIWLSKLTKIKFLEISTLRTSSSLPPLDFTNMKDLEMICLSENDLVTNETLESLKNCHKLKSLDLSYNNIPLNEEINSLKILKEYKALKYCDLSCWNDLNQVAELINNSQIQYLAINDYRDYPENVIKKIITECEYLTHLDMYNQDDDDFRKRFTLNFSKAEQITRNLNLSFELWQTLHNSNWCEIIPIPNPPSFKHLISFCHFTNIKIQYHKKY